MSTPADKIRAALEYAYENLSQIDGDDEVIKEALSLLEGKVIVPVELTEGHVRKVFPDWAPGSLAIRAMQEEYRAMIAPYVSPSEQAVNGEKK